jgi:FkbM family methyltransferase
MFVFFFDRSYWNKAHAKILQIQNYDEYYEIILKDFVTPIYFPRDYKLETFFQIVVESLYPNNWHYYESNGTPVMPDDVVLDCGAAEGLFSFIVANRSKKVYAIEPSLDFIKCLQRTFLPIKNVEVVDCALSNREYKTTLKHNGIESSLNVETINHSGNISVMTLDHLIEIKNIRPSYIKMDLEGHDYAALEGAKETIFQYKPRIAVTTYHHINHARQIKVLLQSIHPAYRIQTKGIYQETGSPVMLHAVVES